MDQQVVYRLKSDKLKLNEGALGPRQQRGIVLSKTYSDGPFLEGKTMFKLMFGFLFLGCASAPHLDPSLVRAWGPSLEAEFPHQDPVIAQYRRGDHELFYLAAAHTSKFGTPTFNLVDKLFREFRFDVLLIEPIAFSYGKSPAWYLDEAKKGRRGDYIVGGESAVAVILADEKKIPFYAGEPDHLDIYRALKLRGYSDLDVIAFYTSRQIPQWIRDQEPRKGLLERKVPDFTKYYCRQFQILKCPELYGIKEWYSKVFGRELTPDVSNNDFSPTEGSPLLTHKISAAIAVVRDHFTLDVIEKLLRDYKRVAVIYGAGHFVTLRKSFDAAFGEPTFISDAAKNH